MRGIYSDIGLWVYRTGMTFIEDFEDNVSEDNVSKNFVYVWVGGDGEFIS